MTFTAKQIRGFVEIVNNDPHSNAGTLRAILDKIAAWLALEPRDLDRIGVDTTFGSALLLVPSELVSPERFDPFDYPLETFGSVMKDEVRKVFEAAPVWIALAIALVPSDEFDAADAVWRLGGVEALRSRWPSVVGR